MNKNKFKKTHNLNSVLVSRLTFMLIAFANVMALVYQFTQGRVVSFVFVLLCILYRLWCFQLKQTQLTVVFAKYGLWALYVCALAIMSRSFITTHLLDTLFVLLMLAQGLTFARLKETRELLTLVWVLLFFIAVNMMFYLGASHLIFLLMAAIVGFISLFVHFSDAVLVRSVLRSVGYLSLLSSVMAAVLFVLMPQLPPLWQMPKVQNQTRGLQSEVNLGDLAKLSQSANLAFRAQFNGTIPQQDQLYWRAFSLAEFNGTRWQLSKKQQEIRSSKRLINHQFNLSVDSENRQKWQYQIVTEASYQNWLFALDYAVSETPRVYQLSDFSLYSADIIKQKFQYQVTSYPNLDSKTLNYKVEYPQSTQLALDEYLQLPNQQNPKTLNWVKQLKRSHPEPEDLIQAVLNYFRQQNFYYSLNPKPLKSPIIDDFLFNQQEGFCEHYASSLAYVLRLAGIPSRLVVGYLGGEYNPAGDYVSIYQFDAHAWVEVWLDDKGWQRFDPTAWVAPERIKTNLQQAIGRDQFLAESDFSILNYEQVLGFKSIRLYLANLDYQWTLWVLNYDNQQQKNLIRQLFGQLNNLTQGLLILLSLAIFIGLFFIINYYFNLFYRNRLSKPLTAVDKQYKLALRYLSQIGFEKQAGETPKQIYARIYPLAPDVAQVWGDVVEHVEQLKYAPLSLQNYNKQYKMLKNKTEKLKKMM